MLFLLDIVCLEVYNKCMLYVPLDLFKKYILRI